MVKSLSTILLMVFVLGLAVAAPAATKGAAAKKGAEPAAKETTVTGCVAKGAAERCFVLRTAEGTNYSFAGQPAVDGKCYTVTGTATMGFCHQGTQLGVTKIVEAPTNCCEKK